MSRRRFSPEKSKNKQEASQQMSVRKFTTSEDVVVVDTDTIARLGFCPKLRPKPTWQRGASCTATLARPLIFTVRSKHLGSP
jgi:hypothetical protein